tara:strand:- start:13 stop:264 length:252 start_codon:yes stop_codon:yes gene_type:complete
MRQGGMKPKGHSSGTYWVRANAKTGGSKKKKNLNQSEEELEGDYNDDGVVDKWDNIEQNTLLWCRIGGGVIAIVIIVIALIAS